MKSRPRGAERKIAELLSNLFAEMGMSTVERIPILGRTGPDLTSNELKLVIDVKSRKEVPQTIFFPLMSPFRIGEEYVAVPLRFFSSLMIEHEEIPFLDFQSKLVDEYWKHMEEWTAKSMPDGITALVLHRPKEPFGSSVFIIHYKDYWRFVERCKQLKQ